MDNKEKLEKIIKENPDPSKWSFWIKVIIAVLSALLGAIGEHATSLVGTCINGIF